MKKTTVSLQARRVGDVLVVAVAGVLTLRSSTQVSAFMNRHLASEDARGAVLDLYRAIYLVSELESLATTTKVAAMVRPVECPLVYLVSPAVSDRFRALASEMAKHGLLRVTTTDASAALAWAASCRPGWRRPALPVAC